MPIVPLTSSRPNKKFWSLMLNKYVEFKLRKCGIVYFFFKTIPPIFVQICTSSVMSKKSERLFPTSYNVMFSCYDKVRKRTAELQRNPRLLSIELRTFRHWGGTMIAHYTNGNVLTVKKLLGTSESKTP